MKLVRSKSEPDIRVVIVAESTDDMEVIRFLYNKKVVFGMWKLYTVADDKEKKTDEYIFLKKFYPNAIGLAWVNISVKV